jgi:hypothetical protein
MGQFGWAKNQTATFSITYTRPAEGEQFGKARFHVDNRPDVEYDVPKALFETGIDDGSGYADIHLRTRHYDQGSSMEWSDLVLTVNGVPYPLDLNHIGTDDGHYSRTMMIAAVPGMQRGFTLTGKVRMNWGATVPANSRISGQISFHERSGVVKVEWVENDPDPSDGIDNLVEVASLVDDTDYFGGGLAFFKESNYGNGEVHNSLKALVTLGKPVISGSPVIVYLKRFDMDDPSQNYLIPPPGEITPPMTNPVDSNDSSAGSFLGDDNRSSQIAVDLGKQITIEAGNTGSTTCDFSGGYPGDNEKVVAHTSIDYLNDILVDSSAISRGLRFKLGYATNFQGQPTEYVVPGCLASPLVSVWRTLHVERDAMEPPAGPPGYEQDEAAFGRVIRHTLRSISTNVGEFESFWPRYRYNVGEEDQFEGGKLRFVLEDNNGNFSYLAGEHRVLRSKNITEFFDDVRTMRFRFCPPVTASQMDQMRSARSVRFMMWDDDNLRLLDNHRIINDTDNIMANAYAQAYIRLQFHDDIAAGNVRTNSPWRRQMTYNNLHWSLQNTKDLPLSDDFWSMLIVSGFEAYSALPFSPAGPHGIVLDDDPDGQYAFIPGADNPCTDCPTTLCPECVTLTTAEISDPPVGIGTPKVDSCPWYFPLCVNATGIAAILDNVAVVWLEHLEEEFCKTGGTASPEGKVMAHEGGHIGLGYSSHPPGVHLMQPETAGPGDDLFRLLDIKTLREVKKW